jgi:hypothetical protein
LRAIALAAAAVVPVTLTGAAAWGAVGGNGPLLAAGSVLAAVGWTGWGLVAWVPAGPERARPERARRARWTRTERAALEHGANLKELLAATPRRGQR